jgi:polysaccharide deacetylase 2 family uncharacterized protein YibQ
MPGRGLGSLFAGWRGLAHFWLLVAVLLAATGITLALLGPPLAPHREAATTTPSAGGRPPGPAQGTPQQPKPAQPAQAQAAAPTPAAQRPGRSAPGPIADPDPALLEAVPGSTSDLLPRIADDGRMPMQVYAAGFDTSTRRPRVGLLLAGIGLSQADSATAIHSLPGAITLAISPYAQDPAKVLSDARLSEHEFLLSIPMEPQGFPLNDPGPQALMTNLSVEQNHARLFWALSRIRGYAGATAALGTGLLGERFASQPEELQPVLSELTQRGLYYVDSRVGAARLPMIWSRPVDFIVDEPDTATAIDDKLTQLSNLARSKGSALGLATAPRPITIQRITAWADGLTADGLALAPVSALVRPPAKGPGQ